jgi:hypothetical protein
MQNRKGKVEWGGNLDGASVAGSSSGAKKKKYDFMSSTFCSRLNGKVCFNYFLGESFGLDASCIGGREGKSSKDYDKVLRKQRIYRFINRERKSFQLAMWL